MTDRRGDVWTTEVVGPAQVRKDRFPTEEVYGGSSRPVLVWSRAAGPTPRGATATTCCYARAAAKRRRPPQVLRTRTS